MEFDELIASPKCMYCARYGMWLSSAGKTIMLFIYVMALNSLFGFFSPEETTYVLKQFENCLKYFQYWISTDINSWSVQMPVYVWLCLKKVNKKKYLLPEKFFKL